MDPQIFDPDDPNSKLARGGFGGGGRGVAGGGGGGGLSVFSGGSGLSGAGTDYGDSGFARASRAALLRKLMAALEGGGGMPAGPQLDTVPAMLQPGEHVVNQPAASMPGVRPALDHLNEVGNLLRDVMPNQHFFAGGAVGLLDALGASTSTGAGAAAASGPPGWALLAASAIPYIVGMLGKKQEGPNGLERVRAMGMDPGAPEHFAYGGPVMQRQGGSPYGSALRNPYGRPGAVPGPPAQTNPSAPGSSTTSPPAVNNDPGMGQLPTSWYEELIRNYGKAGAYSADYGMKDLENVLNRNAQGAQAADIRDLQASGYDDPSLFASQLLASRSARAKDTSQQLANARLSQTQSAQDFARQLLAARHGDQIQELLARIK